MTGRRGLIMLVEDDAELRDALGGALEEEGYAVVLASNGRQALDRLKTLPLPNVILLDLLMPVMNGWEFCKHTKADPAVAGIPIVAMSGAVSRDPASPYFIDVNDFVKKPINLKDLLGKLPKYTAREAESLVE
jgi:CheY-like chemotaxis protein